MSPSVPHYEPESEPTMMRKWRTLTRCAEHGLQASVTVTFGLQRPREVVLCPPVCPKCEHIDGPQAQIVAIEALPAPVHREEAS